MMTVLVTGGNGLLGRALVKMLVERREHVRVFDLAPSEQAGVESIVGDLRDADAVNSACTGVETVFHCASVISLTPDKPKHVYEVNVTGTQHIIDACLKQSVKKLLYTSSIDVVFSGKPIVAGDENLPYPKRHLGYYSETKAIAEQAVIAANGGNGLLTCSLRAVGIYGPHDRQRFPALIQQARSGGLIRLGDGKALCNHSYSENVAHAHILAAEALREGSPVAGGIYFITDHEPSNFFDFTHRFLESLGFPAKTRTIPAFVVNVISLFTGLRYRLNPKIAKDRPLLTRYVFAAVCRDFWFRTDKAERDFGYRPIVDQETAFQHTVEWLKTQL